MAQKEFDTPEIHMIELNQRITPYKDIHSLDKSSIEGELLREYSFMFVVGDQRIEGGLQINLGSPLSYSDNAPSLYPFPLGLYEGYSIGQKDTHLELREGKIIEENMLEQEALLLNNMKGLQDILYGRRLWLSLCLFDNTLKGFRPEEQALLKQVELVVLFDESANIRTAVGNIFFPDDLTSTSSNRLDVLMRQNSLGHPIGKGTKGRIPFGRITSFRPVEIQVLAHNDPLTDIDRGKVGMGHPIELPRNLDLIRFTQFEFSVIPQKG